MPLQTQSPLWELYQKAKGRNKRALAKLFTRIEIAMQKHDPEVETLLIDLYEQNRDRARIIGLTGPPGVGKSSLLSRFFAENHRRKLSQLLIAVDPSSPISGGSILGDRARIDTTPYGDEVFIRSIASGGHLGGLSRPVRFLLLPAMGIFDCIYVETVGVGQSEIEIRHACDAVLYCLQPGSGDTLQFMKAGIMEVPDYFIIHKADLKTLAEKTKAELLSHLGKRYQDRVFLVSSLKETGITELLDRLWDDLSPTGRIGQSLAKRRKDGWEEWKRTYIREEYGLFGLEHWEKHKRDEGDPHPIRFKQQVDRFFMRYYQRIVD